MPYIDLSRKINNFRITPILPELMSGQLSCVRIGINSFFYYDSFVLGVLLEKYFKYWYEWYGVNLPINSVIKVIDKAPFWSMSNTSVKQFKSLILQSYKLYVIRQLTTKRSEKKPTIKSIKMSVNKRLQEMSLRSDTTSGFAFLKAVEEMGELAKAINQPHRCDEPDVSEAADAIIALQDFIYKTLREQGHSEEEVTNNFESLINTKADKWEKYL